MNFIVRLRRDAAPLLLTGLAFLLAGCSQAPSLNSNDVADVMTQAALAAAKKLPHACLSSNLDRTRFPLDDKPGWDGWSSVSETGSRYRHVTSPDIMQMPDAALAAFSTAGKKTECEHTIVFEKPMFAQFREPQGLFIEAFLRFADKCPICGAGYTMTLRKTDKTWAIEPPGITIEWMS